MSNTIKDSQIYFGRNILKEALAAHKPMQEIYVEGVPAYEFLKSLKGFDKIKAEVVQGIPKSVQKESHQGIAFKSNHDFYTEYSPLKLLRYPFIIFCNHLEDVHNLGSIARCAAAFGAGLIVHEDKSSASLTSAAIKSSAGCAFHLKFMKVVNLISPAKFLRENGYEIAGMDIATRAKPLHDWKPRRPIVLVLGSEGAGMEKALKDLCDPLIKIPLEAEIDSLNVSHAAAIAMQWIASSSLRKS